MRVGILGGVFNPPHLGHLLCAQEAHAELGLDLVLFVPVGVAPHREVDQDPGAETRVRLCEGAVAGDPRFELSRLEVDRAGPSFSVDTIRALRERAPQDELTLIVGADQASRLPSWREPAAILSLAAVAVAAREGVERETMRADLGDLSGSGEIAFFQMPRVDISSSLVRERAASGRPIRYLVPDGVADYVEANGLYAAPTAGSAA